jgi:hypothetical protein
VRQPCERYDLWPEKAQPLPCPYWALDTLSPAERRWMFGEVAAPAAAAFERVSCHDPALGAATLLLHMALT